MRGKRQRFTGTCGAVRVARAGLQRAPRLPAGAQSPILLQIASHGYAPGREESAAAFDKRARLP